MVRYPASRRTSPRSGWPARLARRQIESRTGHARAAPGQDRGPGREGPGNRRRGVAHDVRLRQEPVEVLRDPGAAEALQVVEPQRIDAEQDDVRALCPAGALGRSSRCASANAENETPPRALQRPREWRSAAAESPARRTDDPRGGEAGEYRRSDHTEVDDLPRPRAGQRAPLRGVVVVRAEAGPREPGHVVGDGRRGQEAEPQHDVMRPKRSLVPGQATVVAQARPQTTRPKAQVQDELGGDEVQDFAADLAGPDAAGRRLHDVAAHAKSRVATDCTASPQGTGARARARATIRAAGALGAQQ